MQRNERAGRRTVTATDAIGRAIGMAFAPLAAGASLSRRARVFHPRGVVYRARVEAVATDGALGSLARRLSGPAIVRLSGAIWKRGHWLDLLGVAIRLRMTDTLDTDPMPGDQDLLLASFRWPWTLPLAPLTTRTRDFLANDYHTVLPLLARPVGDVDLRLRPRRPASAAATDRSRPERLAQDVARGHGRFAVDLRARRGPPRAWTTVATLELLGPVAIDQEALRFSPFRNGRGLEPVGFLQALRRATYPASQAGRELATRARRRAVTAPVARLLGAGLRRAVAHSS